MLTSVRPLLVVAAILLAVTAACGSTSSGTGSSGSSGSTGSTGSASPTGAVPTATPPPSTDTPTVPPSPVPTSDLADVPLPPGVMERPAVRAAVEDAATRRQVGTDQVVGAAFVAVTWNDGSLGCPQKGMSYTQMTVEGELLILRVGTALLQYHGRVGGPYTFCAAPTAGYRVDT